MKSKKNLDNVQKHKQPSYWYFTSRTECVLCGRIETIRFRVYTSRPDDYWKRNEYKQDVCGIHFL